RSDACAGRGRCQPDPTNLDHTAAARVASPGKSACLRRQMEWPAAQRATRPGYRTADGVAQAAVVSRAETGRRGEAFCLSPFVCLYFACRCFACHGHACHPELSEPICKCESAPAGARAPQTFC